MVNTSVGDGIQPEGSNHLRVVCLGIGDTGRRVLLDTGFMKSLPTERKAFVCANTDLADVRLDPRIAALGEFIPTPIPGWVGTEPPDDGHYDDHAAKRPFQRLDRTYRGTGAGCATRADGAIAMIDAEDAVYDAVLSAATRVGRREGERDVTVQLLVPLFAGRGAGSGGLPVFIGRLGGLRDALAQINLVITIAAILPTVRVDEIVEYRRRTAALLAEVTVLAERAVATDAERTSGPWRKGPPWDNFLIFSTGGGRSVRKPGVATDVFEASLYTASVLYERLAGCAAEPLRSTAMRRDELAFDGGTGLPRLFGATGFAELVYEPELAVEHGVAFMEHALYEEVRIKHAEPAGSPH